MTLRDLSVIAIGLVLGVVLAEAVVLGFQLYSWAVPIGLGCGAIGMMIAIWSLDDA
jgi:hypothetical protein